MTSRRLCATFGLLIITGAFIGGGWGVLHLADLMDRAEAGL